MAQEKNQDEPKNTYRSAMLEPDADPKTKKIALWIGIGVLAIALVYVVFYSDYFKRDKPNSQVVIPESTPPAPDTLNQGYVDTTAMQEHDTAMYQEEPVLRQEKVKEPAPKKKETVSTTKATGNYTIYVGSFKNKSLAEKEKERLVADDFDAFILPNGDMFRVAVGRFASRAEAKATADELKKNVNKDCWIDRIR